MYVARIGAAGTSRAEPAMEAKNQTELTRSVWYVFDGEEHRADVPVGEAMWDAVTQALAQRLRKAVESAGAPRYDEGTRNWTLPLRVRRRFLGSKEIVVPVLW